MYRTNDGDEGYMETKSQELWAETPRETTMTEGEKDSESLDSGELYLDIPRTSNRTDGGILPRPDLKPSISPCVKEKSGGKFQKCGVMFFILLLCIGLGFLTYMVLDLKIQLNNSRDSSGKERDELKTELESKVKKNISLKQQIEDLDEESDELKTELESKVKENISLKQQIEDLNEKMNVLATEKAQTLAASKVAFLWRRREERKLASEELQKVQKQVEEFHKILRAILFQTRKFASHETSQDLEYRVTYFALKTAVRIGNIDVIKSIESGLTDRIVLNDIAIVDIIESAGESYGIIKCLFGMFKKKIPTFSWDILHKEKYIMIYKTLKKLLPQIMNLGQYDDTLVMDFFQMYGSFIVNFERYNLPEPFYLASCGLFNKAFELFLLDVNINFLSTIKIFEEDLISKHIEDEEKKLDAILGVRERAKKGLETLKANGVDEENIQRYFESVLVYDE